MGGGEGGDVGSICVGRGIDGEALPNYQMRKWKADSVRGLLIINSGSTAEPFCSIAVRLFGIGAVSLWLMHAQGCKAGQEVVCLFVATRESREPDHPGCHITGLKLAHAYMCVAFTTGNIYGGTRFVCHD